MTLHVELVSPERILWTGEAEMVIARTLEGGEIAFLTGHAPFVGALDIGKVTVRPPEGPDVLVAVHGGFVEVSNNRVTILSDVAELREHIAVDRPPPALARAEAELQAEGLDGDPEAARRRADLRLIVAGAVSAATGH
jgi:F-type H+-transporting ATPase subunit epsilon